MSTTLRQFTDRGASSSEAELQVQNQESEEEVSVESRSRSRSTIRNYDSDDFNLLQNGVVLHRLRPVNARTSMLHGGKSHVLDLLCTQPSAVCDGTGHVIRSANECKTEDWLRDCGKIF